MIGVQHDGRGVFIDRHRYIGAGSVITFNCGDSIIRGDTKTGTVVVTGEAGAKVVSHKMQINGAIFLWSGLANSKTNKSSDRRG